MMDKKILSCYEYVKASDIWPTAKDYIDLGHRPGLVRGYNVEVITRDGRVDWMSCNYIEETIDDYLNDEFTQFYYSDLGVKPTGRICFRGYGRCEYDLEEHENFIIPVEVNE